MNIYYKVPFYANTPDDTHCFQAALKSVLKYFVPDKDFSWEELDEVTAKLKDLWTWPMAGLMWMKSQGFKVHNIESFNYQRFVDEGEDYLVEKYGSVVAKAQIENSDIEQEREISKEFIKIIETQNREATVEDIVTFLKAGYLLGMNVNSRALNKKPGYVGHFVVAIGVKQEHLILHDPGSPPLEDREVTFEDFEKAWAYPSKKERNLIAFKK